MVAQHLHQPWAALAVAVAVLAVATPCASASPLQYMGFYEYAAEDMASWTNVGATSNLTAIALGHSLGATQLYSVERLFFEFTAAGCQLRSDYESAWTAMVPRLTQLLNDGAIIGFFMGDELVWNGLLVESLATAASLVKKTFPRAIVWENEATPVLSEGVDYHHQKRNFSVVPSAIDFISVDMYHMDGPSDGFVATVKKFYETYIYPKMNSHQRAWLVPGSFESQVNPVCDEACYDTMCALDATNFVAWAKVDPMITGIVPWHWHNDPSCVKFKDEIGTVNTVKTKAAWQKYGKAIVSGTFTSSTSA